MTTARQKFCLGLSWLYNMIFAFSFLASSSLAFADESRLNASQFLSRLSDIQKEAETGNVIEQRRLAVLYIAGVEGKPDYKKGVYWLTRAAKAGSAFAETLLAFMYVEGLGVEQDFAQAAHWAGKSADHNNYAGQLIMGALHEAGAGVVKSDKIAAEWYGKSAQDERDMGARYKLGMMHLEGSGVEKNALMAENWLMRGAEKGDAHACYQLGMMYYEGNGVAQDYHEALDWFGRSAEIGIPEKSKVLRELYGNAYEPGEEYSKTIGKFMKRDPLVRANANYMLGKMCESGKGTKKNPEKARFYYTRATNEGHQKAAARLNVLPGKNGAETIQNKPGALKGWATDKRSTFDGRDTSRQ